MLRLLCTYSELETECKPDRSDVHGSHQMPPWDSGIAAVGKIVCVVHSRVPPSLPNNKSRYTSSQFIRLCSCSMLIYVYDDDDDEERKPYPANNVEPGHARLHLNQINRVKCQVSSGGGANRKRR